MLAEYHQSFPALANVTVNQSHPDLLQRSFELFSVGQYDNALSVLEPLACVMAHYLKGKIYLTVAEDISKSFTFVNYPTKAIKDNYRRLLHNAYEHLSETASLLPNASEETRQELNQNLWYEIGKVENGLASSRDPIEDNKQDDLYDDQNCYQYDAQSNIDSVVDGLSCWNL